MSWSKLPLILLKLIPPTQTHLSHSWNPIPYDVIVLGLGAMGTSTAYQLALRGQAVLGIDQFSPPHSFGSSHGKSRIIRETYFEDPLYVPFVKRAYNGWAELQARSGKRVLTRTGGLMIGAPDGAVVSGARASAVEHRLPYEELSAGELRDRFPALRPPDDAVAIWEPRAGVLDPEAAIDGRRFAHYVCFATQASPLADRLVHMPTLVDLNRRLLGPDAWLLDYEQFGIVYQDARPGLRSGYSRIGWHTDHQSGPHLDLWPGVAFTIHFDPTSPANGFLRVLPGSHLGGTDGIPLGFERVPGELAVYQERGDVLFHHSDLWHGAARATADGDEAVRRHLRGSWHGGTRLAVGHGTDDFVKNALR